ncbi:MAG: N-methyl-L-tryptophan oxidase [Fimbriimonadales bacterium]|nr:N-methyl-L-tryptophan oxidase [Fimbriimonadales bacterium]
MRIAIIGLGAVGSAALRFLAKQGHKAVGYEQFTRGHTRGSSHGESRIYRLTYADPHYTRLMRRAFELWQELQAEAGEQLIVPCGVLWLGEESDPELNVIAHALRSEQVAFDWLDASETAARFPAFRLEKRERALFQSEGGVWRVTHCVLAHLRPAEAYGAVICENTRIVRIERLPNHIVLETEQGALERFDRVLITAGAWIPKLLPELNLPLTVTRQTYAYFAVQQGAESHFEPACMPVWIEATRHFYGFPLDGRQAGVKIALHQLGEAHDPDLPARPVDENDLAPLRACIHRRLPEVSETVLHAGTCLYTNAPDEKFLIQHLPGDSRVWFVSACSGHGFKFSILNGYEAGRQVVREG